MNFRKKVFLILLCGAFAAAVRGVPQPGVGPGPGTRYATDAYPAFDRTDDSVRPEKKEPKWFSFLNGPKKETAAEQFAWAQACAADGAWGKACRAYDALVREWPTAPEAPKAQRALADLLLEKELDFAEAFAAYRYLLDFYSLDCDYSTVAEVMYKVAELMRREGKTIVFFRFSNTEDVRRAYESLVLRAPGAAFVPQAMLTIAALREEAGEETKAVAVYENLRNLHPETDEALTGLYREANVRMRLLEKHGSNRARVADTAAFLRQALQAKLPDAARAEIEAWLARTREHQEEEAYRAAVFYDSRMRTRRSAVSAYERFLAEYPASRHAGDVRARLAALKEKDRK
jgi:outer membrane protein assembly factor BamD (BamD/ComL family)